MNINRRNQVLPQIKEITKFLTALFIYNEIADKKELPGDAHYLLSEIYLDYFFKKTKLEEFIKALFDGLSILNEEKNFNTIVKVLADINYEKSIEGLEKEDNLFLNIFKNHDNSRIMIESLLRILNYEDKDKNIMYRVLQCLMDIIDFSGHSVMYSSDLESFINMSIIKLESTYTDELRFYILEVLLRVTKYDEYYKTRYKFNDLMECMESYINHHSVNDVNKILCNQILKNLKSH